MTDRLELAVLEARALLNSLTPLCSDCGQLCGAACCQPDGDGQGGIYLFPGEERLYDGVEWAHVIPCSEWENGHLFTCNASCQRDLRPLGCRLFPLTPVRLSSGWNVRMDWRGWAMCPLMRFGRKGLNPAFVEAARSAVQRIGQIPEGDAFLTRWQQVEDQFRQAKL